jgi:hypothetical protein
VVHKNADEHRKVIFSLACALEVGPNEEHECDHENAEETKEAEDVVFCRGTLGAFVAAPNPREAHLTVRAQNALVAIGAGTQGIVLWRVPSQTGLVIAALDHVVAVLRAAPVVRHGKDQIASKTLALFRINAFFT